MASIPATSAARPWLARLPPGLFGISLGLLGLAGAWRRMQPLIGEAAGVVFTVLLSTGRMPAELVTPALYLPIVPGGLVGGMALAAVGFPGWAGLLFGSGTGGLPTWVAWSAVAAASAVIGFLAVRTVLLLVRGRLLPLS